MFNNHHILALILALILVMSLLPATRTQAYEAENGIVPNEAILATDTTSTSNCATNPNDPSTMTMEVLQEQFNKFTTWKEFSDRVWNVSSVEDEILVSIFRTLDFFAPVPRGNFISCVSFAEDADFDLDRLSKKVTAVVEYFHKTHDTFWTMTINIHEPTPGKYVQVDIEPHRFDLKYPPTYIGEMVIAVNNFQFYESAWNFCSGSNGIGKANTRLIINGVAYLDEDGNITSSKYYSYSDLQEYYSAAIVSPISIDWTADYWIVHVCTLDGTDLGWFYPDYFAPVKAIRSFNYNNQ